MHVIPAQRRMRLRQVDGDFKANLGYIARPYLQNKFKNQKVKAAGCQWLILLSKQRSGRSLFEASLGK
jgi:hypothetical protein